MPMEPTFDDLAVTLFEAFPNALHVRQRAHGTIFGANPRDERLTHGADSNLHWSGSKAGLGNPNKLPSIVTVNPRRNRKTAGRFISGSSSNSSQADPEFHRGPRNRIPATSRQ